jgi:YHS domain-containing protein
LKKPATETAEAKAVTKVVQALERGLTLLSMKTIVLALSLCLSSIACGGAPAASPATEVGVKAPGEAAVGDKTRCPVSGEVFTVSADSPKVEVEGKTYYMCCGGCTEKFKADPKKYLTKG